MTVQAANNVQAYLFRLIADGAGYNDIAREWEVELAKMGMGAEQAARLGLKMAGNTFRAFEAATR